jgi:hypothetical protein
MVQHHHRISSSVVGGRVGDGAVGGRSVVGKAVLGWIKRGIAHRLVLLGVE